MPAETKEQAERALRDRQARLTALAQHPSWAELRAVFEAKKERHLRVLAAKLLSTDALDQRELDFTRGFWYGANWLLANPEQAEESLDRALSSARTREDKHG